jgi:uncharacterized protein (DUF362 family)/Pyruvate/2-oxoacid:ferredoxin oxidoreductase delta subunit
MEHVVALQSCPEYERRAVEAAVKASLDALGGLDKVVRPGARVYCKVNLLVPAAPEQAVSTHPEVVRAVIHEIRRIGGVPVVGDNPAVAKTVAALRKAGILGVLEEEQVEIPDLAQVVRLENPEGRSFRSFEVSKAIVDCDVLLNLPKLKTHGLTYMTCALKNLFGLVPGSQKARWHLRAPSPLEFATLICDLYGAVQRHFRGDRKMVHLIDGILAMEGDGPGTGGTPRKTGSLLASLDGTALDRVACQVAGLDFERLVIVREAMARGLGEGDLSKISCVGAPLETWKDVKFKPSRGSINPNGRVAKLMRSSWLKNQIIERPVLMPEKCSGCQKCNEICPAVAITMAAERPAKPVIDAHQCIRCYCCAEVCPDGAIRKSRTPWLGRALASFG